MPIKKLIVNADDYGHAVLLSEGIRRAAQQGIVTSTTAMMNWPDAVTELSKAVRECPHLGLGVHLVLTSGKPLLPPEQVPSLVDENGYFRRPDPFTAHMAQLNLDEVKAEWLAQIDLFRQATGKNPDHLDSHHHVSYASPALFECMLELAEQVQCPIRNPYTDPSADAPADYLWETDNTNGYTQIVKLMQRYSPKHPQLFFSSFYDMGATIAHLIELIQRMDSDPVHTTFEVMCHPALVDDALRQASDYNDQRALELSILTDPHPRALLIESGIQLVSFRDL